MHSRDYLHADDFRFRRGGEAAGVAEVFPDWTPADRLVVIAPDPAADLARVAGMVLAWAQRFYDRPAARAEGFLDYPSHYVVGGERGAAPRVLGPATEAAWSRAWCRLDVWPSTRHLVADPDPATMLAAAFMLEPNVLLWPARLAPPKSLALPAGPDDSTARQMLRARLRAVWLYGGELKDAPGTWQLDWRGGAEQLTREAAAYLPEPGPAAVPIGHLAPVAPERFLGLRA